MTYARTILATLFLLAFAGLPATAQQVPLNQQSPFPRVRGIIASVASNGRCFTLADRAGNRVTINLDSHTQYIFGRDPGTFLDVMQPGDEVFAHVDPNTSIATDVTNRNRYGRPATAELKQLLDLSDDECLAIVPLLAKVSSLQQLADGNLRGSDLSNERFNLRNLARNPATPDGDLRNALQSLRQSRAVVQRQLEKARADLTAVLTLRQEAILLQQGILE